MTNTTAQELQRNEAVARMKKLSLAQNVIDEFEKEGRVYASERLNEKAKAILSLANKRPATQVLIERFESKHNAIVYHAQITYTSFGKLVSLFYVSNNMDEWEEDKNDLDKNEAFVFVANVTDLACSEFGYIGFKPSNGGVERTY